MMNKVKALFYKSALHLRKIRDAEVLSESEKSLSSDLHTDPSMKDYDIDLEAAKLKERMEFEESKLA